MQPAAAAARAAPALPLDFTLPNGQSATVPAIDTGIAAILPVDGILIGTRAKPALDFGELGFSLRAGGAAEHWIKG